MINPEYLKYRLDILKTHKELQESILRDIVRRIMNTDFEVSDMTAWQAEKLQQAGMVFDDILKEVAKSTGKTKAEIKAAFDDAKTEAFNYDDEVLEAEHIPPTEFKTLSPKMKRMYKAALAKTCTEAINLTKTTATTSMSAYISACDLAHMQITSGAFTYQTAIKNAVISAAKQGCTVIYPSGHKSSLNAAIRRAVLTGVNQTSGKVQEMRADEYQIDLMEISAHAGARPEHAQWQGKIVSRSGRKGYLSLDDIGYGEVTGFMGANCRHDWHMYFEGASKPAYTRKQLNELKNAEVTYNGETMPMWKGIQKQRAMEYNVRQSKSILVACDEAIKNSTDGGKLWKSEFNAEAVKLKSKEAKLRDFCKQTGLNRDRYREQVFATETTSGIKNFGKSTSQKAVQSAQHHYVVWRKSIGAENTPKTLAKYYDMKYNNKREYHRLQKYVKMVDTGEVSPLLGYDEYRKKALELENKLIGIIAKDGTLIQGYSAHFVARTIGRSALNTHFNRPGVDVGDIKDALSNGILGKLQTNPKGQTSRLFIGVKCKVSVNIDTGILIQTNPNLRQKGK